MAGLASRIDPSSSMMAIPTGAWVKAAWYASLPTGATGVPASLR